MPPSWRRPSLPNRPPDARDDPDQRPTLHIGAIGHRRLPRSDPAALEAASERLIGQIKRCAETVWSPDVRIRCVNNLAEGADTLLGEAALASGVMLLCPLPFPRDIYASEFALAEARTAFAALLERAETVVELDGSPGDPAAYLQAARVLLELSDLIVAIWNGEPERGVGGTGQIVREARQAGRPVLVIADDPPHGATMLWRRSSGTVEADLAAWLRLHAAGPD